METFNITCIINKKQHMTESELYKRAKEYLTIFIRDNYYLSEDEEYDEEYDENEEHDEVFYEWLENEFSEANHTFEFKTIDEFIEAINHCNEINGDCNLFTSPVMTIEKVMMEYLKSVACDIEY